ncbi:alginate export family protein [Chitinophaga horti]|uniref:Alginate export family protein n=1 Tax=Chitinophaga horti TaxID=2920382 RepID=A0ABY6J6D5_9BACT|nr:alginate export family protein [Chitinophaga horti]UYQ93797.1 alginate export family protein [Chitinophaga horti]
MKQLFTYMIVALACLVQQSLYAQQFKLMRFNEDYNYLSTDTARSRYQQVKYLPLGDAASLYASFGGEARYEYVLTKNEDWTKNGQGTDQYTLHRYLLHADLHLGKSVRVFAQLASAFQLGGQFEPGPLNEDKLAIQNLFADVSLTDKLTLRLGRQELDYGTGRLISVREGTNARKYFTGGKIIYKSEWFGVDGFVMMNDDIHPGVFDNKPSREANLWGAYAWLAVPASGNFDFYYLGTHRDEAIFEEGTGREDRHTIATRYWKYGGGFVYNIEAAYQFGRFGTGDISAWTLAIDIGHTFGQLPWKPSLNLRNDYISGDKKAGDNKLQTFNPLFPKGGYFGFNPRVGPANLIDIHPYLGLTPSDKLSVQADVVFNWRYSLNDGIYRPSGNFNTAGSDASGRYIGAAYLLSGDYVFSPFIKFSCGAQYFQTGAFIHSIVTTPANSFFFNTQLTFKF